MLFRQLGFTYDLYTRTDQHVHHQVVQELFGSLLSNGYLYSKSMQQTYCETDARFLPDRYVEGTCPVCGKRARGDQCDDCQTLLDPADLLDRTCGICGSVPVERSTEHYYFALSRLQEELAAYASGAEGWRDNAAPRPGGYARFVLGGRRAAAGIRRGNGAAGEGRRN